MTQVHAAISEPGRRRPARALIVAASTVFSLLLHGSVLAAAYLWIEDTPGAVATPTEAISLELFRTDIVESVALAPTLESAASLTSVDSEPGETIDSESVAASAEQVEAVEPQTDIAAIEDQQPGAARHGLDVLEGGLVSEEAVGVEKADTKATDTKASKAVREKKTSRKTAKLTDTEATDKADRPAKKKGAAAARASKGSAASPGRISASSGSAINYAARVRARVASRRPGGAGRRGTVVVSFGVTRSGGLSYASIARSSGNPSLDRTVLSAVRSAAPFPVPPPGAQLRFAVPFHFR